MLFGSTEIEDLEKQGWKIDDECQQLQEATRFDMDGPTFMRAPDGLIYAADGYNAKPVDRSFEIEVAGRKHKVEYNGGKRLPERVTSSPSPGM